MMEKITKRTLVASMSLLLIFSLFSCDEIKRIEYMPLGTGHSAHDLCTRLFVSSQQKDLIIEDVLVQKVYPLQWVWSVDIDEDQKQVSVGAPFFQSFNNATAVYREAQGCTLSNGKSIASLQEEAVKPLLINFIPDRDQYWPFGTKGIHPVRKSYDTIAMDGVIDEMFQETSNDRFGQKNTYAVLVAHKGKLIAERYSAGHDETKRMLGWSISKSVTALLLGILHGEGKVDLEMPIKGNEKEIAGLKLRHVLNMASGLDFDEGYEERSDISDMLYVVEDASAYAKNRPLIHKPGTVFNYSTGDTQILADIIQRELGGSTQLAYDFYQQRLFHKLSIVDAVVEHDPSGTFIGGARMLMRARDWAKIGQLMLNEGSWNGEEIIASDWIKVMLSPSKANKYYGGQVWLYDPEVFGENFPEDGYALWGVLGQLVVVIPSQDLVVVRLGANGSALSEDAERETVFKPVIDLVEVLP